MSTAAAALRRDFDRAFAEPFRARSSKGIELLAVRVAGEPYLLPLRELAGLVADGRIVAVPTALPEFLGVTGIRGAVVPVYDLGAILGHGARARASAEPAVWLALAARGRLAFAFDAFDGQRRVPRQELQAPPSESGGRGYVRGVVRLAETLVPVVDLPGVVDAIERRASSARKEEH